MHLSISLISLSIFPWRRNCLRPLRKLRTDEGCSPVVPNPQSASYRTHSQPRTAPTQPGAFHAQTFPLRTARSTFRYLSLYLQAYLRTVFTCMSANLVKYLHLHKNFNWHHLLNSKENSFSCLSRAIAASSRASSFPKATPRAQEPSTHSRSIPQASPRAQEPPPHSRSRPAHQPASDLLNQSKYYNFATI